MVERAEAMERGAEAIEDIVRRALRKVQGTVRVTSVPVVINRLLLPALGDLLAANDQLRVELIPDARDLNLTRREADLAVRLARPDEGGASVLVKRLGALDFAIFAPAGLAGDAARSLPWISYDDSMSHLPQARWLAKAIRAPGNRASGLRVADAERALEAVAAGLGRTLLPHAVGERDRRLA